MKKLKVMTVLGTRPEIIRLSRIIPMLEKFTDHTLVHTGQNYDFELNEIFFSDLNLSRPDLYLNCSSPGESNINAIGKILIEMDPLLRRIMPDAVFVLGDTNSCLSAIAAKKLRIPVFHYEAGNRCFDQNVPEESNRKIVDHISDINITYSEIARSYLLREGLSPDRVINVGSPMREVIEYYSKNILESKILSDLSLVSNSYIVVSAHREENIENQDNFSQFINMINKLAELYLMPVILSAHPRTMKKLQKSNIALHGMIRVMKPIGFTDYICLQKNSYIVLSDSGTITEESSIIGFDAINIRENFERPEGMEVGAVCLTGFDFDVINNCIQIIKGSINKRENVVDYLSNNVSEKIIKILYSYNNYVKKYIYHNK